MVKIIEHSSVTDTIDDKRSFLIATEINSKGLIATNRLQIQQKKRTSSEVFHTRKVSEQVKVAQVGCASVLQTCIASLILADAITHVGNACEKFVDAIQQTCNQDQAKLASA